MTSRVALLDASILIDVGKAGLLGKLVALAARVPWGRLQCLVDQGELTLEEARQVAEADSARHHPSWW